MASRACVLRVLYARVLVPPNLYIHTYIEENETVVSTRYASRIITATAVGAVVAAVCVCPYCPVLSVSHKP